MSQKYAFVTLATNDNYAKSAIVLANTIKNTRSNADLICLVPQETYVISSDIKTTLAKLYTELISIKSEISSLSFDGKRSEIPNTVFKLEALLLDYDRIVILDADLLILKNIDELFQLKTTISAVSEFAWPDCFNTAVVSIKPDKGLFQNLMSMYRKQGSFDGGDQGILNEYFPTWDRLPVKYNLPIKKFNEMAQPAVYGFEPSFCKFGKDVKVVHFIGGYENKPWVDSSSSSIEKKFKQMWNSILSSKMRENADGPRTSNTDREDKNIGASSELRTEFSFDEIWTHISNQF